MAKNEGSGSVQICDILRFPGRPSGFQDKFKGRVVCFTNDDKGLFSSSMMILTRRRIDFMVSIRETQKTL